MNRVIDWTAVLTVAVLCSLVPSSRSLAATASLVGLDGDGRAVDDPRLERSSIRSGAATPSMVPGTIGVDAVHGFAAASVIATGTKFDDYRALLIGLGHTIVPLTRFEAADLAGLDALILMQPHSQNAADFTPAEVAAIQAFVASGHGLLAHAEAGGGSSAGLANYNGLIAPYGVAFAAGETEGSGHTIRDLECHPLTEGVAAFGIDYQRRLVTIGPPAMDMTVNGAADDALAVVDATPGCSNVVLVSDASMFTDPGEGADTPINYADNTTLLTNMIGFILCDPPASPCTVLSVVFDAIHATTRAADTELVWRTLAEDGTLGFVVERAATATGHYAVVTTVAARGPGVDYRIVDAGRVGEWYRVVELTIEGRGDASPPVHAAVDGGSVGERDRGRSRRLP